MSANIQSINELVYQNTELVTLPSSVRENQKPLIKISKQHKIVPLAQEGEVSQRLTKPRTEIDADNCGLKPRSTFGTITHADTVQAKPQSSGAFQFRYFYVQKFVQLIKKKSQSYRFRLMTSNAMKTLNDKGASYKSIFFAGKLLKVVFRFATPRFLREKRSRP